MEYQSGFGNEFASEAVSGALPIGQNSPQRPPLGLYTEQISGTPFTAPRASARRSWTYRIRPSARHAPFEPVQLAPDWRTAPLVDGLTTPAQSRWSPAPLPAAPTDFLDGLRTLCAGGSAELQIGCSIHIYTATRSMSGRYLADHDAELLILPQEGGLHLRTEMGRLDVNPGEFGVVPRGIRFAIDLMGPSARGYACENYGPLLRLPERGPIGANGLANERDFLAPVAAYEDVETTCECLVRHQGRLWRVTLDHSPLDVVAWHGSYTPYKYDLSRFMALNSVTFDHPDPSIFTVLTSPSAIPGTANVDLVVFPPRWTVAEHTFRPPWFHRNVMHEFMGLITGRYDARQEGFLPGGASLHPALSGHGPDAATVHRASEVDLQPERISDTLAFMLETSLPLALTPYARSCPERQADYHRTWESLERRFRP